MSSNPTIRNLESWLANEINLCRVTLSDHEMHNVKEFIRLHDEKEMPWDNLKRKRLLPDALRRLSLQYAIDKKLASIPSAEEIQDFTLVLETSSNVEMVGEQRMIAYCNFLEVLSTCCANIQNFLKPVNLFKEFVNSLDENGRLPTDMIVQYLSLKSNLFRYRVMLSSYDLDCSGFLNRKQLLEFFEKDVFTKVAPLMELDEGSRKWYLKTVMTMLFFFLDHKNFGHCRISDIVISGFIENIFVLQTNYGEFDENRSAYENWFSPEKTLELCSTFNNLDEAGNGYLTKENFSRICDGNFTSAFVDSLFEVHVANRGLQMSYEEFVVFQIAQEHLAHPASIAYFFNALDINKDGYLSLFELNYFYKDLKSAYCNYVADSDAMPVFNDFADLLFDMVLPYGNQKISIKELLKCKQAHDFILCLINFVEFYRYETRESESADDDGEGVGSSDLLDIEHAVEMAVAHSDDNNLLIVGIDDEGTDKLLRSPQKGASSAVPFTNENDEVLESIAEEMEPRSENIENANEVSEEIESAKLKLGSDSSSTNLINMHLNV